MNDKKEYNYFKIIAVIKENLNSPYNNDKEWNCYKYWRDLFPINYKPSGYDSFNKIEDILNHIEQFSNYTLFTTFESGTGKDFYPRVNFVFKRKY